MFKTMFALGKSPNQSYPKSLDTLINDLHREVRTAAPGARLTPVLRCSLERLDKAERKEVVSSTSGDLCSPLFIACKKGNLEIVDYLIEVCGADIEQKGVYDVADDKTSHRVSPLWCAAVSGKLSIVKCLVKHGANVNCVSDSGSTPIRSACFMTNYEVVQYLVEHTNADIQLANYNGGTCLINSVQSSQLCEYLLTHGANVNAQDIQLKTALNYAIQEHRFDTTKLLLAHKADPFLKNRYGDDALQTSCLKGAVSIFYYLLENIDSYSTERKAEAHELMGTTFLDEHHDIQMALQFWRKAIALRSDEDGKIILPKRALDYTPLYAKMKGPDGTVTVIKEFNTREELEDIATDLDQIRMNSLLIAERILMQSHKDFIFRTMYRGAAFADSSQSIHCIRLWRYALQLRIQKDSLLYADTCFTALALIRLYLDIDSNSESVTSFREAGFTLEVEDLLGTYELLVDNLPPCAGMVRVRPVFKRQQESFDRCIRCCAHLIFLLLKADKTPQDALKFKRLTEKLVKYNLRMCSLGDSLLHQAVSAHNVVKSHFFGDDQNVNVFPNVEVAEFLLDCGADVNATNYNRQTPLHYVCGATETNNGNTFQYFNSTFHAPSIQLLLARGAHIDQLDNGNHSPLRYLQRQKKFWDFNFAPMQHLTLKCLAARKVCAMDLQLEPGDLPEELRAFVELHRATPQQDSVVLGNTSFKQCKNPRTGRLNSH